MIPVSLAEKLVLGKVVTLPVEAVPLAQAYGRILREDIKSDRDQPPFDKALMDGIALSARSWHKGKRFFPVQGVIAAGDSPKPMPDPAGCVRIMTGAVVPRQFDVIVPVEHVRFDGGQAHVEPSVRIEPGQYIRRRGADARKGDGVLQAGLRLDPPSTGIAASVGKARVKVTRKARIAIVATGNELVDVGKPIQVHQTRLSNSYALQQLFTGSGLAIADRFHLHDDKKAMLAGIRRVLRQYDMLVLSGGVSMGEKDFVPEVLAALAVRNVFHKVAQKPGKPLWFGLTRVGNPVFGLPGNPISTLVCAYRYVLPYLYKASGITPQHHHLALKKAPAGQFAVGMTYFLPVRDGNIVPTGGSGDWASLAQTDGFIQYDNTKQTQWPYFSWRV